MVKTTLLNSYQSEAQVKLFSFELGPSLVAEDLINVVVRAVPDDGVVPVDEGAEGRNSIEKLKSQLSFPALRSTKKEFKSQLRSQFFYSIVPQIKMLSSPSTIDSLSDDLLSVLRGALEASVVSDGNDASVQNQVCNFTISLV